VESLHDEGGPQPCGGFVDATVERRTGGYGVGRDKNDRALIPHGDVERRR
jgi:hypothetical protein